MGWLHVLAYSPAAIGLALALLLGVAAISGSGFGRAAALLVAPALLLKGNAWTLLFLLGVQAHAAWAAWSFSPLLTLDALGLPLLLAGAWLLPNDGHCESEFQALLLIAGGSIVLVALSLAGNLPTP
jgi:hypothetical protein